MVGKSVMYDVIYSRLLIEGTGTRRGKRCLPILWWTTSLRKCTGVLTRLVHIIPLVFVCDLDDLFADRHVRFV